VVSALDGSNLCIMNSNNPTRLPSNGNANSLDLTLVSAHLAATMAWSTHIQLNLDHLPITVDFGGNSPPLGVQEPLLTFALLIGLSFWLSRRPALPLFLIRSHVLLASGFSATLFWRRQVTTFHWVEERSIPLVSLVRPSLLPNVETICIMWIPRTRRSRTLMWKFLESSVSLQGRPGGRK
jgi:hypothetical protein